jgi:PhnB protein
MAHEHVYQNPKVAPYLMVKGGEAAIAFYGQAFGAVAVERYDHEGKVGHATLSLNGSHIMLSDEYAEHVEVIGTLAPRTLGGTTVAVNLAVDDVDAAYNRAVTAGAAALMQPKDEFYGRSARLRDPFGHVWSLVGPKTGAG